MMTLEQQLRSQQAQAEGLHKFRTASSAGRLRHVKGIAGAVGKCERAKMCEPCGGTGSVAPGGSEPRVCGGCGGLGMTARRPHSWFAGAA